MVFHTEYATVWYTNFKDDLVDISEGIVKTKCKYGHNDKKCETCGISYEVCNCWIRKLWRWFSRIPMFMF